MRSRANSEGEDEIVAVGGIGASRTASGRCSVASEALLRALLYVADVAILTLADDDGRRIGARAPRA
jgi:hypothetical protein